MPESSQSRYQRWVNYLDTLLLGGTLGTLGVLVYDLGFFLAILEDQIANGLATVFLFLLTGLSIFRIFLSYRSAHIDHHHLLREWLLPILLLIATVLRSTFGQQWIGCTYSLSEFLILAIVIFVFFVELSKKSFLVFRRRLNPTLLFMISFLVMIILGAALLLMPAATTDGIEPVDALFTSTSAVCVTGLSVLDTQYGFTRFGQTVILLLIQIGGLGIMTFTSVFAYFFTGKFTFDSQIFLSDLNQEQRFGQIFHTLYRVIFITLGVEAIGFVLVWLSLPAASFEHWGDHVFTAIFHSVSAFCNAGFSTYSKGLYEPFLGVNYFLHLTIAALIILGGIGFSILYNLYEYLKYRFWLLPRSIEGRSGHRPWVLNFNSRIILMTTFLLLVAGTVLFLILEWNGVLKDHTGIGKLVEAFFLSVTPRTAGFNTVDMAALAPSTIILVILFMWIGASPGSTGGGIKTSTFALASLNIFGTILGKNRIEIYRREVSNSSLRLSYTVISLSLIVIGIAIFFLMVTDPEKGLISIGFEVFSAFSTVGLSLGITSQISSLGKLILILTMFIGRVGAFTILISLFKRVPYAPYRYPKETVTVS